MVVGCHVVRHFSDYITNVLIGVQYQASPCVKCMYDVSQKCCLYQFPWLNAHCWGKFRTALYIMRFMCISKACDVWPTYAPVNVLLNHPCSEWCVLASQSAYRCSMSWPPGSPNWPEATLLTTQKLSLYTHQHVSWKRKAYTHKNCAEPTHSFMVPTQWSRAAEASHSPTLGYKRALTHTHTVILIHIIRSLFPLSWQTLALGYTLADEAANGVNMHRHPPQVTHCLKLLLATHAHTPTLLWKRASSQLTQDCHGRKGVAKISLNPTDERHVLLHHIFQSVFAVCALGHKNR